jgi:hypothetical protein
MSDTSAIDAATRRLTLALDALEGAAERRREAELGKSELAAQIHALDDDRARLASDLDNAVAQGRSLENANREIAKRLDAAMDSIRSVLEAHDS